MFWCSALHLINVFKHRTVVKHTHTGLQLQLVDAQSGAGQAWKPQWFSILEKHSTKTCTLTRNLSTYVCPPPSLPQMGEESKRERTYLQKWQCQGEERMTTHLPRTSEGLHLGFHLLLPQLLKMFSSQGEHAWDTWQRSSDFSYVISPLSHAMWFPQQLSLLRVCKGPSSLG